MTKLEKLIQEFCPDGVEFRPLEQCCNILDRKRKPVTKSSREAGKYPYYGANGIQDYVSDYIFDGTFILVGEDGSVITDRGTPVVTWASGKIWVNNHAHIIEGNGTVLLRFLYHYIQTIDVSPLIHGNIPKLTGGDFRALTIPVPPLEVQREIVRILDSFADLTSKLTESLSMELTARKQQYMYYRDILLNFDPGIKQVKLGDICSLITKGTTPKKFVNQGVSFVKTEAIDGSKIILDKLSYIDEETHTSILKRSILEENDILITIAGATIGKCLIVPPEILPANTNQALAIVRLAKGNSPRYILHLLQSGLMKKYIKENIKGSAQPNLTLKQLNDFVIPLPTLSVQQRLVEVLDNFDAICSDLNIGLPAEIEARKKQYEFYRDQLLTFAAQDEIVLTDRQTDRQTDRRV